MGIPIDGPANVFRDNDDAVVINSSRPESTLKKKHAAIASGGCWGLRCLQRGR
jgi:hypothetical protein